NVRTRDGFTHECKTCMRLARRLSHMKRNYGLSQEAYDALLASQGGVCAICGGKQGAPARLRVVRKRAPRATLDLLRIDHDHATGEVRGLLCHPCNSLLGYARENPDILQAAIQYLAQHRASQAG